MIILRSFLSGIGKDFYEEEKVENERIFTKRKKCQFYYEMSIHFQE